MMSYKFKVLIYFCFIFIFSSNSVISQLSRFDVDVFVDENKLQHALAGGLNSPQFSEVDLNNDGIQDLYIFDKTTNKSLTFINNGTENEVDYTYAPYYEQFFPELDSWVLLRDYNDDGVQDIFTFSDVPGVSGIYVYTGKFINNTINFVRYDFTHIISNNLIPIPAGNGFTQLYITNQDYPAVDDVDLDGDLDILSPGVLGGYTYFYKNQSIELGYGKDSLIYETEDECWGRFKEIPMEEDIGLSDNIDDCFEGFHGDNGSSRHPGTTLLTFDADADSDLDLIIGVVDVPSLSLLTNGGDIDTAFMTDQIFQYPNNTLPVNIINNPVSFYIDINNDGVKDLLASPNSNFENLEVVWEYNNIGENNNPDFQFVQKDWLVGDMIDVGDDANPTFVDYNADGLMDMVIGNGRFFQAFGQYTSRLYLYENIGSLTEPAFELVDKDYLGMSDFDGTSTYGFAPTFGDIDTDGDMDILIGEVSGRFFFGENIAGAGNPINIPTIQFNYMGLDLGNFSTPQIIDLNRDGKMDIVTGEKVGRLVYFENMGTATEPMFLPNVSQNEPAGNNIIFLGEVDTQFGNVSGYAAPYFVDFNGEYNLFTGSELGGILHYTNIEGNLESAFSLVDDNYGSISSGYYSTPEVVDINNDGRLEMFVGNVRGGITAYQTNFYTDGSTVATVDFEDAQRIRIQPNPAKDRTNLVIDGNWRNGRVAIYNAVGQLMEQFELTDPQSTIGTQNWNAGIYFIQVELDGATFVEKLIVR